MSLLMLEEQILYEGPEQTACIMIESIPGAAGVLTLPEGYMQGVRALCDKYDILLHLDEVMVGFGRTGHMWGFQRYDGVVPDIVTSAKGLSSSITPISMVAISDKMLEFFEENPMGWGSTFQAHPVAMAAAYANIKEMLSNDVIGHVQSLAPIFDSHMKDCAASHPSIKQYRAAGLFGALDIANPDGTQPHHFNAGRTEATAAYAKAFNEVGLIGLFRPPVIHVAPPLIISEEELKEGFEKQHQALDVLDKALGY
jgi:adenosylmethionine-8-amino-7-oxononanoate aminotransferase